jgi:hypothetical protein
MMAPRSEWNRMGPKLPPWFRVALRRIDKRLVPQFIPVRIMRSMKGVHRGMFPHGVWAICRRVKCRSRLLWAQWVWNLSDRWGMHQSPGWDTIRLIRYAASLWKRNGAAELEDEFGRALDAQNAAAETELKDRIKTRVAEALSAYGRRMNTGHVFQRDTVPHIAAA